MWVKNLVKLTVVLQFAFFSSQSLANAQENELSTQSMPSIWDDEVVSRMVRDVLVNDLIKEKEHNRLKRQHKRDVQTTAAVGKAQTTRKTPTQAQKTKKPTKVAQAGNKTKIRVTSSTISTKATVKPSTKPIVIINPNVNSVNTSKIKVRIRKWFCGSNF